MPVLLELERLLRAPASRPAARPSFRAAYSFIDTLPTSKPFTLKMGVFRPLRDHPLISNAVYLQSATGKVALQRRGTSGMLNSKADFRSMGDMRTYHPSGKSRPLAVLERSAADVKAYDPWKEYEKWIKTVRTPERKQQLKEYYQQLEGRALRLRFSAPRRVVICLKRAIRRQIMHALGVAGTPVSKIREFNETSKIIC